MSHVGVEKGGIRGETESVRQGKEPWLNVMLENEFGCVLGWAVGGGQAAVLINGGRAGVGITLRHAGRPNFKPAILANLFRISSDIDLKWTDIDDAITQSISHLFGCYEY